MTKIDSELTFYEKLEVAREIITNAKKYMAENHQPKRRIKPKITRPIEHSFAPCTKCPITL